MILIAIYVRDTLFRRTQKTQLYGLPRCSTRSIILKKIPHRGGPLRGQVDMYSRIEYLKKESQTSKLRDAFYISLTSDKILI
jgi:hypothetical protein